MNILFLTQILPYPPDAGPKFKTWQVLRYLMSLGHRVTLISMVRSEELQYCPVVQKQVTDFYPVQIKRSRLKDAYFWIHSAITRRPFLVDRDDQRAIRMLIALLVSETTYDAIHADQITMTQFALPYVRQPHKNGGSKPKHEPSLLFDAHNATYKILERFALESGGVKHFLFQLEAKRIRRYESEIVSLFDHILTVSHIDESALIDAVIQTGQPLEGVEEKFQVIPITVDTKEILPIKRTRKSANLFTIGTLHYPPNADGIRWFFNEAFPIIREAVPEATLTIVGKNPPADFINLQNTSPDVYQVPGYVDNLTPWFEQASVVLVPVRVGGGMRVRILEAFAREMPVVTTTIGLEGIDAIPGEHVLVADDAEMFAQAVIQLIGDRELQNKLAGNGRRLVEEVYDQQVVLKKLEQIYPVSVGA